MYSRAHFGEGIGPILIDAVGCRGSESRLLNCLHDKDTAEDSHAEDAGVHCQMGEFPIYYTPFMLSWHCALC